MTEDTALQKIILELKKDMSQYELAKKLGVSWTAVQHWLKGWHTPTDTNTERIIQIYLNHIYLNHKRKNS